ncbi:hypothetical protein [Niveibacterium sp. SC-1]|uniref:hypothetical protein n=1 Tax=Niveibacterium sp. SC-1 TaxID=3135646 RepID=UPI0031204030
MASNILERTGERNPQIKGHGDHTLGPSDSSDSGSDLMGNPLSEHTDDGIDFDQEAEDMYVSPEEGELDFDDEE